MHAAPADSSCSQGGMWLSVFGEYSTTTSDGACVATAEQMLLHVDMKAGKTCPAAPGVLAKLMPIAEAHKGMAKPESVGRHVGQRRS